VFLGEDNSVKLGDFGLSKMIQSHDFASTYVGTPFYMSPEICAAEKYTLKSDIWSLGCIIYELCAREPPFNAKSHFQLVQKIKEGKVAPLPDIYSPELMQVIKDCLKVNPDRRPETAQLLNLPVVRLMRKEKEVVDLSKVVRAKEETLSKRQKEMEEKIASVNADKAYARQEIDASLRREWEVKARLEIDRQINMELDNLQKRFESEVQARVEVELQKKTVTFAEESEQEPEQEPEYSSSLSKTDYPYSSVGAASADGDFPSITDITELSMDSPDVSANALKKSAVARTPFGRAQTMFVGHVGTPMDVEMASPSPIAIASLALSPRRNAATKAPSANTGNIFATNPIASDPRWDLPRETGGLDSDDDDVFPSPTRQAKSTKNPFASKTRPVLQSQKSAPLNRLKPQIASNIQSSNNKTLPALPNMQSTPDLGRAGRERCPSPNRRLSKIPSAANLIVPSTNGEAASSQLTRKPSITKKDSDAQLGKLAAKNNIKGRTLVELQQARAGGRPLSAVVPTGPGCENVSPKRAFRDRMADRRNSGGEPVAVWDPDRDEMPSPFIVRRKAMARV
jgi:NIMA (never in mitosis gene a)-related kinase 2